MATTAAVATAAATAVMMHWVTSMHKMTASTLLASASRPHSGGECMQGCSAVLSA